MKSRRSTLSPSDLKALMDASPLASAVSSLRDGVFHVANEAFLNLHDYPYMRAMTSFCDHSCPLLTTPETSCQALSPVLTLIDLISGDAPR